MFSPRTTIESTQVQRCLDMITKVQDMVSTFQLQNAPASRSSKNRPSTKSASMSSEPTPVIPQLRKVVEELKKRLESSPPKSIYIPNLRRFKQSFGTSSVLGPGVYEKKLRRIEQDHEFVTIPRLEDRFDHKLSTFKAKRKNSVCEDPERITIFDMVIPKTPREVREKIRLHNEKIEINKSAAKEIQEFFHENRKIKLTAKLQRIKWLENKEEILQVKSAWRALLTQAGVASILRKKIRNFIKMKKRAKVFRGLLMYCSRFLGFNRKNLMKRRRKINYKNVINFSKPASTWVLQQVKNKTSIVFTVCNRITKVSELFNLMYKWKKSAKLVIRLIKTNKIVMEHRKHALHLLCQKLASQYKTNPQFTDFLRICALPYLTLDKLITVFIQDRIQTYTRASSKFTMYGKSDLRPYTIKVNPTSVYKDSKRPEHPPKFSLYTNPLLLLSHLMRLQGPEKQKKTLRFKF